MQEKGSDDSEDGDGGDDEDEDWDNETSIQMLLYNQLQSWSSLFLFGCVLFLFFFVGVFWNSSRKAELCQYISSLNVLGNIRSIINFCLM